MQLLVPLVYVICHADTVFGLRIMLTICRLIDFTHVLNL